MDSYMPVPVAVRELSTGPAPGDLEHERVPFSTHSCFLERRMTVSLIAGQTAQTANVKQNSLGRGKQNPLS